MHCCPRDRVSLVAHLIRGTSVFRCKNCAGVWLPPELIRQVVGHLPQPDASSRVHSTQIHCPNDGCAMVAIHHRGVEIDLCTGCGGVWLDRGELERILKARPASNARLDISTVDALDAAHLGVELTAQLATEVITNESFWSSAGELTGGAVEMVLEFIGGALSGF